jgi:NADPH-dependent 2,4-dienoyl-CoA reductase/sulfur reductase-like enzyme
MSPVRKRIIVVGGVASGPSAASKAARTDPAAEVILFEEGESVSYGICEIPYYLAGDVDGKDLIVHTPESLKATRRVDVRVSHRVEAIAVTQRRVRVRSLATGKVLEEPYDRLILATGAAPATLGLEGERCRNVFHIRTLEGAHQLKKFLDSERPRRAVIVGAGYVGLEMAESLRRVGMEVTLLHNHELPLDELEPAGSAMVERELRSHGVRFVPKTTVVKLAEEGSLRVTHVLTSDETYPADLVVIAVGVVPRVALAREAGLRIGPTGAIQADLRRRTSVDTIYAAGDCSEVKDLVTGAPAYIPLATVASKTGWVAGENAAGGHQTYRGAIRALAIRVFGLEVAQVGINRRDARARGLDPVVETITAPSRASMMPGKKEIAVTLVADRATHRLLGATLIGEEGAALRSHPLAVAVRHRMTVEEVREWDLAYAPMFSPLWDPILVASGEIQKRIGEKGTKKGKDSS